MNPNPGILKWSPVVAALALASSSTFCRAADIVYGFDSGTEGWHGENGSGSVSWDPAHGVGGGGCLKLSMAAGVDTQVNPGVDVTFNTTGYYCVEFDIIVDAGAGMDGSGTYGNLQVVTRDAASAWASIWLGPVGTSYTSYRHVKRWFGPPDGPKVHLGLQLAAGAPPYSSDVIAYIDNVVIRDGTPPAHVTLYDFNGTNDVYPCTAWVSGSPPPDNVIVSRDRILHPDGSLKITVNFNSANPGWQEGDVQLNDSLDWYSSKFQYLEFDLYVDAPTNRPTYGIFGISILNASWQWTPVGSLSVGAANIGNWRHCQLPLPRDMGLCHNVGLRAAGPQTFPMTYYVDDIRVYTPDPVPIPPTFRKIAKGPGPGSPAGVQVAMESNGDPWQHEAIVTPPWSGSSYTWVDQPFPVSYSFTLTSFPDPVAHPGFQAYLFIVNEDTFPPGTGGTWTETYGGCDSNAADIVRFTVQNLASGGVHCHLDWKTNRSGASPLPDPVYHPVSVDAPSALGSWTLTFTDNNRGSVAGPGIPTTPFALPPDITNRFNPAISFLQFGMHKNDAFNNGHNNAAVGVFSRLRWTGLGNDFDECFPGPGLDPDSFGWRRTSASGVQWIPAGTAWWLTWLLPDDGFVPTLSANVAGPYTDAGVTYTYTSGATRVGAVPASSIPAGNACFFRLAR